MGFGYRFSEDVLVAPLKFKNAVADATGNIDVRNNNVETDWVSLRDYDRVFAYVQCDHATWNSADGVTTLKLEQAQDATGTGKKDVTTSGAGLNYNTTTDTLTASDSWAILEARAEDLDSTNNFFYVRLYAASTGNSASDKLFGFLIAHDNGDKRKQIQGAPTATTKVYVNPQTSSNLN